MTRIVVSDHPMIDPETYRRVLGDDVTVTEASLDSAAAIREMAAGAAAVVSDVSTPMTAAVFAALPELRLVAQSSIGVDNVDLDAAREAGVTVTHAPAYCTEEVATHALALLLSCVRAVPASDRSVRGVEWVEFPDRPLHRLGGQTLGFVSFGGITRHLASLVRGFDVEAVAFDPYVDADVMAEHGVRKVSFETLCAESSLVVSNAPATPETTDLLDADAFARLPDGAVVVNTGRGAVVDEAALREALESGSVVAAGLDVLVDEPPGADHPLVGRDDVVVTPHAGWYSEEAHAEVNDTIAEDVRGVLAGEDPAHPVVSP